MRLAEKCPNLQMRWLGDYACVRHESFLRLAKKLSQLADVLAEVLHRGHRHAPPLRLAGNCSNLQELPMAHCASLTDASVSRLAEKCQLATTLADLRWRHRRVRPAVGGEARQLGVALVELLICVAGTSEARQEKKCTNLRLLWVRRAGITETPVLRLAKERAK